MVCSSKKNRPLRGKSLTAAVFQVGGRPPRWEISSAQSSAVCNTNFHWPTADCITNREFPIAYFEKSSYLCAVIRIVGNVEVRPMNVNHRLKA